jgi:hypothetical protein
MKGLLKNVVGRLNGLGRKSKFFMFAGVAMLLSSPSYALEIVTKDATTGAVDFVPTAMTSPLETAVIAAVCAVAGVLLIIVGSRWLMRLTSGRI